MRIVFIQIAATDRQCFTPKQGPMELPDDEAQGFIRAGYAVEAPKEPAPATAPDARKTKTK